MTLELTNLVLSQVPWEFHPELLYKGRTWWQITLYVIFGTLAGSAVGFTLAMRMSKKFNKAVRESVFFKKSGIAKNPLVRQSLRLPPLEELSYLFDEDDRNQEGEKVSLTTKNRTNYS
jgi:hypothetical protein